MAEGIFITVEGTDGSGKTTQINMMEEYLTSRGFKVLLTREPGGTKISEKIRSIILDLANSEMSIMTELFMYAAARAQLVSEVIKPALKRGEIVICDRFVDSSYAYQGFGRGIDLKIIADINRAAIDGAIPDITFFFDLDPEIALGRRISATGADRIEKEKMEFHKKVHLGYKKLAVLYPERIKTIDASGKINEITDEIKEYLDDLII